MQDQDLVELLAGSAALFPRGFNAVLQQQKFKLMEKQQQLKLAPRTSTTLIRQPYFSRQFGLGPLMLGLNWFH